MPKVASLTTATGEVLAARPSGIAALTAAEDAAPRAAMIPADLFAPKALTAATPDQWPEMVGSTPYVFFVSSKSPKFPEYKAAGLDDGQSVLMNAGQLLKASPLKYYLIDGVFLKTRMASTGDITHVSTDPKAEGLDDHWITFIVVELNGQLVPARMEARTTKTNAITPLANAIKQAATPEWLKLSEAHKLSAAFPHPFGRVVGNVTTAKRVAKSSGNPYYQASCRPTPTTLEEMTKLNAALSDGAFLEVAQVTRAEHEQRVDELKEMAK